MRLSHDPLILLSHDPDHPSDPLMRLPYDHLIRLLQDVDPPHDLHPTLVLHCPSDPYILKCADY